MGRKALLLTGGAAAVCAAMAVGYGLEIPNTVVLKNDCEPPRRFAIAAKVRSEDFWSAQLAALKAERRWQEEWPQRRAKGRQELDALARDMERRWPKPPVGEADQIVSRAQKQTDEIKAKHIAAALEEMRLQRLNWLTQCEPIATRSLSAAQSVR